LLAPAVLLLAMCGSSDATNGSREPHTAVVQAQRLALHGTYVQPPVAFELKTTKGASSPFRGSGGTTWHGDLEGSTTFIMKGVADLKTFASRGTNEETFIGSVVGVGSGRLRLHETFTTSPDRLSLDATIVSSDGALAHLRGRMHFEGPSDPTTGVGHGTYTATFTASR
jgi:hypothetical protein